MRRADRLFEIIQVLRGATEPLSADAIAERLETSRRTIYRDIAALMARRVPIRGEAGVGYVLERGFHLPPLMLDTDEVEAVALGAQWVVAHADPALARAAGRVLAKLAAVVPEDLRSFIADPAVGTAPRRGPPEEERVDVARLREWSRDGRKLSIDYSDAAGEATSRVVWPFLVGFHANTRAVIAWCELRGEVRVFLVNRITAATFLDERYPERPAVLRKRWLASLGEASGASRKKAVRKRS